MSRGEPVAVRKSLQSWMASMRPRRIRRGEQPTCRPQRGELSAASMRPRRLAVENVELERRRCRAADELQCGHGDSAVENARRRLASCNVRRLQCGHGDSAVENALHRPCTLGTVHGFNAATAIQPWRTATAATGPGRRVRASMRPRRFGRGERRSLYRMRSADGRLQCGHGDEPWRTRGIASGSLRADALQCGHGDAVENTDARCHDVHDAMRLQCGHGDSAVENSMRRLRAVTEPAVVASMRPRRFAVENRTMARAFRPVTCRRFNAATAIRRGERRADSERLCVAEGFNAATAIQPWRTLSTPRQPHAVHGASMRPRRFAVENACDASPSALAMHGFNAATAIRRGEPVDLERARRRHGAASMRPRRFAVENAKPSELPAAPCRRASMRPRRLAVENAALQSAGSRMPIASMRPRRFAVENQSRG